MLAVGSCLAEAHLFVCVLIDEVQFSHPFGLVNHAGINDPLCLLEQFATSIW